MPVWWSVTCSPRQFSSRKGHLFIYCSWNKTIPWLSFSTPALRMRGKVQHPVSVEVGVNAAEQVCELPLCLPCCSLMRHAGGCCVCTDSTAVLTPGDLTQELHQPAAVSPRKGPNTIGTSSLQWGEICTRNNNSWWGFVVRTKNLLKYIEPSLLNSLFIHC